MWFCRRDRRFLHRSYSAYFPLLLHSSKYLEFHLNLISGCCHNYLILLQKGAFSMQHMLGTTIQRLLLKKAVMRSPQRPALFIEPSAGRRRNACVANFECESRPGTFAAGCYPLWRGRQSDCGCHEANLCRHSPHSCRAFCARRLVRRRSAKFSVLDADFSAPHELKLTVTGLPTDRGRSPDPAQF